MYSFEYQPVRTKALNELHDDTDEKQQTLPDHKSFNKHRLYIYLLVGLLCSSLALNILAVIKSNSRREYDTSSPQTPYAELTYDNPIAWTYSSPWFNNDELNHTHGDLAWSEQPGFNFREGIVALKDTYTESVGLPSSQRWPWDESKGIYFIEGIHTLHCVKYLRNLVIEAQEELPYSASWRHLHHCIDGLRQFVMCHADDTPRYTGRLHSQATAKVPFAGMDQPRQCRNWDKLVEWSKANSACYRWTPDDSPGFKEEDRYKSCPDGRVLWEE